MFNKKLIKSEIAKIRKELDEHLKSLHERLSDHWNIIAEHTKKIDELKQYIECSVCGCLVSKEKAKVEWEMRPKGMDYDTMLKTVLRGTFFTTQEPEKEAVKTYKCLHCQKGKRK